MTKDAYYADKAALLDPRCYVYRNGASWSDTVPTGEAWFLLNAWRLKSASFSIVGYLHRYLDVESALMLPEGAVLEPIAAGGFAYYARPKTVFDIDARYTDDPEELYFSRLERLKTLPLIRTTIPVFNFTPRGTFLGAALDWGTSEEQAFMVRHVCTENVGWTLLVSPAGTPNIHTAVNTQDEIIDDHIDRRSAAIMCPMRRYNPTTQDGFAGIMSRTATESGVSPYGPQQGNGESTLMWSILPSDW
jgi:hypothetical protein